MKNKLILSLVTLVLLTTLIKSVSALDLTVDVTTSEDVNSTTNVNTDGNANINVDVNAGGDTSVIIDGTNIGEEIDTINNNVDELNNTVTVLDTAVGTVYQDLYGTSPQSPDHYLQVLDTYGTSTMSSVCEDQGLQEFLNSFSATPSIEFVAHMKELGYDDEAHINMIWTICQEEKLNSLGSHVGQNEGQWMTDGSGANYNDIASLIEGAINWLLGKNKTPTEYEARVANSMDSYFASDADTYYLLMRIQDLEYRVEALEKTANKLSADAYCQGKLEVLVENGLESVSCGDTFYHNHMKDPSTGEDIVVGLTPV